MKVLIDINHPAHVHFFRNLYFDLIQKGYSVTVTASKKDITFQLLEEYKIPYTNLGTYGESTFKKLLNVPIMALKMIQVVKKNKPDFLLGIASSRIAHAALFFKKSKSFVFTDTEHASLINLLFKPFATKVVTPDCFPPIFNKKQVLYKGYHELAYLHPNYFTADPNILKQVGIQENEKFTIVRFITWNASHDIGQKGLTLENKIKAINAFKKLGKVFISSEGELPKELEKYQLKIETKDIHNLMSYASLVYGESATMASEASVLGVHSIFCDFAGRCYTTEQEKKYGLVHNFGVDAESQKRSIAKGVELLKRDSLIEEGKRKKNMLLSDTIDVTSFQKELLNF